MINFQPKVEIKEVNMPKIELHQTSFSFAIIKVYKLVLFFPVLAFSFCIFLSLIKDFDSSTSTHCKVPNYLPSISSAIGGYIPQKFIWQYLISLQSSPRIFLAFVYRSYYMSFQSVNNNFNQFLVDCIAFLNVVENLSLLFLSVVSSTDIFEWHAFSFVTFVLTSELYMIGSIFLLHRLSFDPQFSYVLLRSLKVKTIMCLMNISCILMGTYFYRRHNHFCEPGVYTLFALCEYGVVLSNILFHSTGFLELQKSNFVVEIGKSISRNFKK